MPVLTLEAIEADPWNAVQYELPAEAGRSLLDAALRAVQHCVDHEHKMILVAEDGLRTLGRTPASKSLAEIHKTKKARWVQACARRDLIAEIIRHQSL